MEDASRNLIKQRFEDFMPRFVDVLLDHVYLVPIMEQALYVEGNLSSQRPRSCFGIWLPYNKVGCEGLISRLVLQCAHSSSGHSC